MRQSKEIMENRRIADLLLQENSRWFIILRWYVIAILPLLALFQEVVLDVDVVPVRTLLFSAAGLCVANVLFWLHHNELTMETRGAILLNVWFQILVDMVVIAILIFNVESAETVSFIPLLFLPHIVLSGIMLGRGGSFVLVVIAGGLYSGCLLVQDAGEMTVMDFGGIQIVGATALFVTIWYMVSHLAVQIYARDTRLSESHKQVRMTYETSRSQMYHTAHQMKSPIVAIQSILELYKFENEGSVEIEVDEILDKIDHRCEMLLTSVSEMLLLAKLKSGESVSWHFDQLPIDTLLKSVVDRYKHEIEDKRLDLVVTTEPFTYLGDHDSMEKMFDNLVSNAVHYTTNGGKVEVIGKRWREGYRVSVRDNGIGIKADQIESIFDPHFRTIEAKRHCNLSTGLGLAIVKEAATFHDVDLTVESEEGVGSCFFLTFPSERRNLLDMDEEE